MIDLIKEKIKIYTDGSCNPQYKTGAWAAIIFYDDFKITLHDSVTGTTHNRMELLAVLKSLEYVINEKLQKRTIELYTDSQYVVNIPNRAQKLIHKNFKTNSGKLIQNADLVQQLIDLLNKTNTEFIKVKAHQKASSVPNYNREVDKLSRKIVRNKVENPE